VFRLLFLALLALVAFVMIEAHWTRESMTLTLRVRTGKELLAVAQGKARELGERAVDRAIGNGETPPVAAPPPAREPTPESLRESDRERLHKLVEEKSRER
jgi:hypothetical protein